MAKKIISKKNYNNNNKKEKKSKICSRKTHKNCNHKKSHKYIKTYKNYNNKKSRKLQIGGGSLPVYNKLNVITLLDSAKEFSKNRNYNVAFEIYKSYADQNPNDYNDIDYKLDNGTDANPIEVAQFNVGMINVLYYKNDKPGLLYLQKLVNSKSEYIKKKAIEFIDKYKIESASSSKIHNPQNPIVETRV